MVLPCFLYQRSYNTQLSLTVSLSLPFIFHLQRCCVFHRIVFKQLAGVVCERKAKIKEKLIEDDALPSYKKLVSKDLDWSRWRYPAVWSLPSVDLPPPPKKKKT